MIKGKYSKMALASFALVILSVISIIFLFRAASYSQSLVCAFIITIIFAISAVVFGFLGFKEIHKHKKLKGKLLALIGIILGIDLILSLFLFLVWLNGVV
jgi:hypothetical protein